MSPESITEKEISSLKFTISKLIQREDLSLEEAKESMSLIFDCLKNEIDGIDLILSTFFFGLTSKGLSMEELLGIASAMEESKEIRFNYKSEKPIVTGGGTGGDNIPTINVTTPAILIAASAGALTVKSGAKAFSSTTGAIDLVTSMGINAYADPKTIRKCLDEVGTAVWASSVVYPWMDPLIRFRNHPSFSAIVPIFSSLRLVIATSLNPFSVKRQIRGTAMMDTELIAKGLYKTGHERALVPIGYGPNNKIKIDEISTIGKTIISELKQSGEIETYEMHPRDFGIKIGIANEIRSAENHKENAKITTRIISGQDRSSRRDLVLVNAGAILYLADRAKDIKEGYEMAIGSVDSGRALKKVEDLVKVSNGDLKAFSSLS
ncbi:MAG: hypothetical protein NWF08_01100 [Candidatus Bathyarchaeota archaeon]|nr:hypothetical protein [Candidatus Bathyarchaeota archaeon]